MVNIPRRSVLLTATASPGTIVVTLRCIDIETTGTDPASDAIVEIASVDLQRDHSMTNFKEALVNPWNTRSGTCQCGASPDPRGPRSRTSTWLADAAQRRELER
jgi:DNA polymerase III epsilon subunit-like protein